MNAAFSTQAVTQPWTRFLHCADAYGAQRTAWPVEERGLYDQFALTIAGQQALRPARDLDGLLAVDMPAASSDFMARLNTMPLPPQVRTQNYMVIVWRRGVLLMLLMAALGFGNGYADASDVNQVWNNSTMTTEFGVSTPQ